MNTFEILCYQKIIIIVIVIGSCTAVHCTAAVQELKELQGSSYNTVAVVIILFSCVPFV